MEAQSFRDLIIQNPDSIKKCIVERKLHDQKTMMTLNERKLQMQECKVTVVQPFDANLVVTQSSWTASGTQNFASQVVEKNALTKPVTPHSWPKVRESACAKPHHVNAPGPFKNSSKTVSKTSPRESIGSYDMVHNYYLQEAKKNIQIQKEQALNSKPSVIPPDRIPNTTSGRKPKPRNSYQQPRNWPPSMRIRSSAVYVKTTPPRSGLTWKPTGRICTYVGLRWIPMGKTVGTCLNINDSVIPLGKETCTPNTDIYANSSSVSAGKGYQEKDKIKTKLNKTGDGIRKRVKIPKPKACPSSTDQPGPN
ncbi:hypothetical protein Tco_0660597 [Tanacetum coccineum]